VAKEGKTLVFVEVKTRKVIEGDPPQAAVNVRKQNVSASWRTSISSPSACERRPAASTWWR
jgi:Holliday junction resolvase-like predicted endonuclease